MAVKNIIARLQSPLRSHLLSRFKPWPELLKEEDEMLGRLAHADMNSSDDQHAVAAAIEGDLESLDGTPLEIYMEILIYRLEHSRTPVRSELRRASSMVLAKNSGGIFARMLSHHQDQLAPLFTRLASPASSVGELSLGEILLRAYGQLSPAERTVLEDRLEKDPQAIVSPELLVALKEAAERKWTSGLGSDFVYGLRHASADPLARAILPGNEADVIDLRYYSATSTPDTVTSGQLVADRFAGLFLNKFVDFAEAQSYSLPRSWLGKEGAIDQSRLTNRAHILIGHIEAKNNESTKSTKRDILDRVAEYIGVTRHDMDGPNEVAHMAFLDALERQELENALAQIRTPASATDLAAASAHIRWHVSNRLAEDLGGLSPASALSSIASGLQDLETHLEDRLKLGDKHSQKVNLEQVLSQQTQFAELREKATGAIARIANRIEQMANAYTGELLEQEGQARGLKVVKVSALRENGPSLLENIRTKGVSYVVYVMGRERRRALLTTYEEGSETDSEEPIKELYLKGGKLVGRAFKGETILIRDKRAGVNVAVLTPLDEVAEMYWSKVHLLG